MTNQNMKSSLDEKAVKKKKEEQRQAKDELLTEKKLIQEAKQERDQDPAAFGKKVQPKKIFKIGRSLRNSLPFLFGAVVLFAIFAGFRLREMEYFTAEEGTGYALGIIGGSMMLALLLYPLRKRFRILRIMGDVRAWFGLHMVLGVLGPVLILFHSNFSLGSTNSNVALFSMLIVSISGVIGRYIYTKIHHGLYGQKIEVAQLKDGLHHNQQELAAILHLNPDTKEELFAYALHVLTPPKGLIHSWERVMSVGIRSRLLLRKIRKIARLELAQNSKQSKKEMRARVKLIVRESEHFLQQTRKLVEFNFYERMFALWHVLHLPLFFMLVIASIVHVIAVHWY